MCCASALGANTNQVRVGILRFVNLSGQTNFNAWRESFPGKLQFDLLDSRPARLDVYYTKVLKQLTNNAWDGQRAVTPELARKVGQELRLQKMISGSFKRDEKGWEVEVQITRPGEAGGGQTLVFKDTSTHNLFISMAEKTCSALGVAPNPAWLELLKKYPISNTAIDKEVALHQAYKDGAPKEALIDGLRAVIGSEREYPDARGALMGILFEAKRGDEALVEARKLVEIAPGMCWGYVGVAEGLTGPDADAEREQALLQALKVHPGCPSAARTLFPAWVSQGRWDDLRRVAGEAHEALPGQAVSAAALAAALAKQGDQDAAWNLLTAIDPIEEEEDPDVHATLMQAAVGAMSMHVLSRELLWLQRHSATNDDVRNMVSQVDASFSLRLASESLPTNPPPPMYSPEQLQAQLAKRLTPQECALAENPLLVSEPIAAQARSLTVGVTNPTLQATILFAFVIEERLQTEQQATNLAYLGPLPECHQFASRLVSLARSLGLPAWLVHVDLVNDAFSGYHDRAAIQINDQVLQFDPSMGCLGSTRDKYRILDDLQAIAHHLLQGEDLARIRIAQKLDPDDPWSRLPVIMKLTRLGHLEEAEASWKALGPEFTNRWDYYFSRAQIEDQTGHHAACLEWLQRASSLSSNNPAIYFALGLTYGSLHDEAKSAEYLEKAKALGANRQDPSRRSELETRIQFARAMANPEAVSEKDLRSRAAGGDLAAQMILANILLKKGENDEALRLVLEGAKKGDANFQAHYGRLLFLLKGPSAAPEAVEWLRKAARRHQPVACYSLALILYQGTGVPQDHTEASQWAHVGSAQGDKDCQTLLKEMQLFADGAAFAEGKKRAQAVLSSP
jgi:TPR repeat protein